LVHSLLESPTTWRPVLRLAMPVLLEHFLGVLVVYSDRALAGHFLGKAHQAAMGTLSYLMWFIPTLFSVAAIAATAMTARFTGAGQLDEARRAANQALLLGALLTLVVAALLGVLAGPLLHVLHADTPEVAALVQRYLGYIVPVLPALMLTQVGAACLRGAGDTVSGMICMAVVNVVNVAASWSLVAGWFGLPRLGWDGVALGTALGYLCGGTLLGWFLVRGRAGLKVQRRLLRPQGDVLRRLLRIGIPGGTDSLLIVSCHLWFFAIVARLGLLPTAAHALAVGIEAIAYLPGTAFQVAAATMVGQYLGARDRRRAGRSVTTACLMGGGLMAAAGALFFAFGEGIVRLFVPPVDTEAQQLVAQAGRLLRIVALAMPALAMTMIVNGALRGAGDTRWPLVFSLLGMLGVRIPAAYFLAHGAGLGVEGAWYAMVADLYVRCFLVLLRFRHGGWQRIEV
jgi:putative MATE family efflux protein